MDWQILIEDLKFASMLLKRDISNRYAGNLSGAINAYFIPFLTLTIYAVIFSFIFGSRIPGQNSEIPYAVYLCSGLVIWLVVAEALPRSTGLFVEFSQILRQKGQRKRGIFLFLYFLIIQLFVFFMSSLFILHILHIVVFNISGFLIAVLFIPLISAYLLTIGIFFAYATLYIPDLRTLMSVFLQIGFWGSPIAYTSHIVPVHWQSLYSGLMILNPFYGVLAIYQDLMTMGKFPEISICVQALVWFLLMIAVSAIVIRRFSKEIADLV